MPYSYEMMAESLWFRVKQVVQGQQSKKKTLAPPAGCFVFCYKGPLQDY